MEKHLIVKKNKLKNYCGLMLLFVISMLVFSGCSHSLHITNLDEQLMTPVPPLKEPVKIGVSSGNEVQVQNARYVAAIVEALKHNSNVGQVVYPYSRATSTAPVDVLVDIAVNTKYDGKGNNFFVNFPGFIIFAPAIWGYGYDAWIDTQVSVTDLKSNVSQQISSPAHYTFRHADIDRTWTVAGGWVIWPIPLVGGFVFTGYDPDITDLFITKVSPSYGPYVASKIMASLPQSAMKQASQEQQQPQEDARLR